MSKVDWITWNTDPKEILNPNEIVEKITMGYQDYNNFVTSRITENLKKEMETGGLNRISLNVYGNSPAYEKTTNILNHMNEITILFDSFKKRLKTSLDEQKEIEKSQLIQSIEEKIAEEKKKLDNTELLKNRVSTSNQSISLEQVEEIIQGCRDRIERLQEKLEVAKEL